MDITTASIMMMMQGGSSPTPTPSGKIIADKCYKAWRIDGTDFFVGVGKMVYSQYSGGAHYRVVDGELYEYYPCCFTFSTMWGTIKDDKADTIYGLKDAFGGDIYDTSEGKKVVYTSSEIYRGIAPNTYSETAGLWYTVTGGITIRWKTDESGREYISDVADTWGQLFRIKKNDNEFEFHDGAYRHNNVVTKEVCELMRTQFSLLTSSSFTEIEINPDIKSDTLFDGVVPEPEEEE